MKVVSGSSPHATMRQQQVIQSLLSKSRRLEEEQNNEEEDNNDEEDNNEDEENNDEEDNNEEEENNDEEEDNNEEEENNDEGEDNEGEDEGDEEEEEEEEEELEEGQYLTKYKLHFLECKAGEVIENNQGNYENNVAVYRLCPADECNAANEGGCDSGYGDYVVGLNTFVNAYLEEQRENDEEEDDENEFDLEDYIECGQLEYDDEDRRRRAEEMPAYYVGPACTEDGTDIKLDFFSDYQCTTPEEDTAFEDLVGYELPYNDGGLAPYCKACYVEDDDEEGEVEVAEMCEQLAENNAGGCEILMKYYDDYQDDSQCNYISQLVAKPGGIANGATIAFWVVIALVIIGVGGATWRYCSNSRKKSSSSSTVNSQGLLT